MDKSHSKFLELLSIADEVSSSKKNQRIHLIALNYLGDITLKAGAKDLAYEEYEKAFVLAEKYDNEDYQIQAILNRVSLENNPEELISVLNDATNKFSYKKKNRYSLGQIKYALGLLYAKNNQETKALEIFHELLKSDVYKSQDNVEFYKGIGIAYRNKKNYALAIQHFDTALNLVEEKTIMQLQVLIEKAETYSLSGQYDNFNDLMEKVKPTIDDLKDLTIKKRINLLQINVYEQTKNIVGKAKKLMELQALNEKIEEDEKALLVSIVTNIKDSELKKQTEAQNWKANYLKLLLALASLLSISILTSLFLFYKHTQSALRTFNEFINGEWAARKRIAGQLHDTLGAHMAAIRLEFILLKKDISQEKHKRLLDMQSETIKELRHIIYDIMPPALINGGIITATKAKMKLWENETLQFKIVSNVDEVEVYDDLKFALYRCILECVNNAMKYANASEVTINFYLKNNRILKINILDNGNGFDTSRIEDGAGGLGISGMRSRIEYFRGKFHIQSKQKEGTTVQVVVPIKQPISRSILKRLSKYL